jgi:Tfp pilus assembly protein PilF
MTPTARAATGRTAALAAVAGAAGFLLYASTIRHGWVFDDVEIVAANPLARDPWALRSILASHYWAGVYAEGNLWRPLTIWSFALVHALAGAGPGAQHLVNAALHGVVSALVALLGGRLGLRPVLALMAGLLFAAHPIHVEAVAPAVGRSEILAALGCLGAWLAWRRAFEGGSFPAWLSLAAASFAAALLSKENAIVLPVLLLADEGTRPGDPAAGRRRLIGFAAMAAVLSLWLAARTEVVTAVPEGHALAGVFEGIDPVTRARTAVGVIGRYLALILVPARLSADYSFRQIPLITSAFEPRFLLSLGACVALVAAGLLLARRRRLSGLAILIFFIALFPASNIAFSSGVVMAERLLYLPSLGFCLLLPALAQELAPSRAGRPGLAALAIVTVLFAGRTIVRLPEWKDPYTLFSATVLTSPESAKAHYNLGVSLDERGEGEAAMREYRRAIEIKPDMAPALRNYGLTLLRASRPAEAIDPLHAAARLDPSLPDVSSDLGIALRQIGRRDEAEAAFRAEIRSRPQGAAAHFNLASLLLEEGKAAEAADLLDRAVRLTPEDADAQALRLLALAQAGRDPEVAAGMEVALRASPGFAAHLVPLAREAMASGERDLARLAAAAARSRGEKLPADLDSL